MIGMGMRVDDGIQPADSQCTECIQHLCAVFGFSAVNENGGVGIIEDRAVALPDIQNIYTEVVSGAFDGCFPVFQQDYRNTDDNCCQ